MSYQTKVYRKQGGDELVVASGGAITLDSGGYLVQPVQTVSSSATIITADGVSLVTGTTVGPSYVIARPVIGVLKHIFLAGSTVATARATISNSTGVTFGTSSYNQLSLSTSTYRAVSLIGVTTSAYRIVGSHAVAPPLSMFTS